MNPIPTLIAVSVLALAFGASAQSYPTKPIRIIVPYPPGGSSDLTARTLAQKLTPLVGQPVIVENKPGAGGNIAYEYALKSAPDGYTLAWLPGSFTVAPALGKVPYDAVADFAPISMVVRVQNVLLVPATSPFKTVRELVTYAKANPNKLSYASAGNGTTPHLAMEMLNTIADIKVVHVPYKGDQPALVDLIGGQVDVYSSPIGGAASYIRAGRVRPLGVSAKTRAAGLPDVPTLDEAGVKGYEMVSWFGVGAPAGTPPAVIDLLSKKIAQVVAMPDVRETYIAGGMDPQSSTPAEFGKVIRDSVANFAELVKKTGMKLN